MRYGKVAWDDDGFLDHQQRKMPYLPMMQDYTLLLQIVSEDQDAQYLQTVALTNLVVNNKIYTKRLFRARISWPHQTL